MQLMRNCPECKNVFRGDECSCGWGRQEKKSNVSDGYCEYVFNGRRCPLPGSMCHSTRGGGPWYCSGHFFAVGDFKAGQAAFKFSQDNYKQIIHERKCLNYPIKNLRCEECKKWNEIKNSKVKEVKIYFENNLRAVA